jgi:protein-tyrosine phosphatase
MSGTRIALRAADRQQLVQRVAEALRQGLLCVLPTETVYGLALLPDHPQAQERAAMLKGRDADKQYTWHVAAAADVSALAVVDDARVQRLMHRYWPGPLTMVLPARGGAAGAVIGVRVPAHPFTQALLARTGPLWLTSMNRAGERPLIDAEAIERAFGKELACIVDDGPSPLGTASTVVRCTGPRLEVLRETILSAAEVLQTAAAQVLFVCTGNTCRSPMAEALARTRFAKAIGVPPAELPARGLSFGSAGTGTLDDMPASDGSVQALREIGIDLDAHRSREASRDLLQRADLVYCMGHSHLRAVQSLLPSLGAKAQLLAPSGDDIADPFGGELDDYRTARDAIAAAIDARLDEWRALLPRAS